MTLTNRTFCRSSELICEFRARQGVTQNGARLYNSSRKSRKYFSTSIAIQGELSVENTGQVFFLTLAYKKICASPAAQCRRDPIKFTCFAASLYFLLKGKIRWHYAKGIFNQRLLLNLCCKKAPRRLNFHFARALLLLVSSKNMVTSKSVQSVEYLGQFTFQCYLPKERLKNDFYNFV